MEHTGMLLLHGLFVATLWLNLASLCWGAPSGRPGWCDSIPEDEQGKFPLCASSANDAILQKSEPAAAAAGPDVEDDEISKMMCPDMNCNKPAAHEKILTNSALYEGDILGLSKEGLLDVANHGALQANAVRDEKLHWPEAIVPYVISKWIKAKSPAYARAILDAIDVYHQTTCVKFRPWQQGDVDYLYFLSGIGCNSFVGKQGGLQGIGLQMPECMTPGLVSHEIMHALGFYHEQARYDRDQYVDINDDNISPDNKVQFGAYLRPDITAFGLDYDFGSVMHYAQRDFAIDQNGWSIQPKPKFYNANIGKMGQRERLSEIDIKKINALYRCTTPGPCSKNPGWFRHRGWCYYFSFIADELEKTFVEARNLCRKLDATMANPTDPRVMKQFIGKKLLEYPDKIGKSDQVWMDGCRLTSGTDPKLNDVNDCDKIAPFICQKRASPPSATAAN